MNPTEARIFTLEARLRSEENCRIMNHNKILTFIENKSQPKITVENVHKREAVTPQPPSSRVSSRSICRILERRTSPGGMCGDIWKKNDTDRKKVETEFGTLHGNKIRPVSPIEINENSFEIYKQQIKNRDNHKSCDVTSTHTPKPISKSKL